MASVWGNVLRVDAKRVLRDRFLLLIVFYLPVMALVMRWAIPALAAAVQHKVDISQYYAPLCGVMVLTLPYVMGSVLGLQLLEEKDERSLIAVVVTPFSFHRYFVFRAVVYGIVGAAMLIVSHYMIGIVSSISLQQLLVVAAALSLNTPLSAIIAALLAKNQVQGFAVMKGSGMLFMIPLLSFFVPQHWDLLFGVIPFYWPIKAYYLAVAGGSQAFFWGAIVAAFVAQTIALWILYRLLAARIPRV